MLGGRINYGPPFHASATFYLLMLRANGRVAARACVPPRVIPARSTATKKQLQGNGRITGLLGI